MPLVIQNFISLVIFKYTIDHDIHAPPTLDIWIGYFWLHLP